MIAIEFMNRPKSKRTHPFDFNPKRAEKSGWSHVYDLVKKIPSGRVITYGQLAKWLRLPGGARTAGRAMSACPSGSGVPWHRVLGSGGRILLRDPHSQLQRQLLESEGVAFAGTHVDLPAHSWSPKSTRKTSRSKRVRT
jgi:methylated-DNA-protein-cysteine methyltransferase-like protein